MQTISSYLFRIGGDVNDFDFDYVSSVNPDLVVLERRLINRDPLVDQIGLLESQGTVVAGYMNVGVYDSTRTEDNPAYDISKFATTTGPFGSLYPDLTDPDWLTALIGELDNLLEQGFTTIYLDDILAYSDILQPTPTTIPDADELDANARAMMNIVNALVAHAPAEVDFIYNGAPGIRAEARIDDASDPMWDDWLRYQKSADVVLADNHYAYPETTAIGDVFDLFLTEFPNAQHIAIQGEKGTLLTDSAQAAFIQFALSKGFVPLIAEQYYQQEVPAYTVTEGTSGNDWVGGTAGADLLHGRGGFDVILGGDGDDTIYGGTGAADPNDSADMISGGAGDDSIVGNGGDDTITGGNGNDTAHGGDGNDSVDGGAGDDSLDGGIREDSLSGGEGNDFLMGGAGFDSLWGNQGNDVLRGGGQADNLFGGMDEDTMYGDQGFDRLFGGYGDDLGYGGDDNDALFGQEDNDRLFGQYGDDRLFGGKGNDLIDGGWNDDALYGGAGFDTVIGSAGNDVMAGNFNADTFVFADFGGGFGQDTITDFDANNDFERIDLSRVVAITDLNDLMNNHISQVGNDVIIDALGGNTITLLNVDLNDLGAFDFTF